jgi:hypothetical protein
VAAVTDNQRDHRADPITDLLEQAQRQWQADQITKPPGANAYESYRKVLTLDPRNPQALAGLLKIGQLRLRRRYLQDAEQLLEQGALQASLKKITEGLRLVPDDTELLALRGKVLARLNTTPP